MKKLQVFYAINTSLNKCISIMVVEVFKMVFLPLYESSRFIIIGLSNQLPLLELMLIL